MPTWFILIEEDNPLLCPITHIISKALAEGLIENPDYQTVERLFSTKLIVDVRSTA